MASTLAQPAPSGAPASAAPAPTPYGAPRVNDFGLPSFDMRDREALDEVIQNMQRLVEVVDLLRGRVDVKVDAHKAKINELVQRIQMCKRKIQCLNQKQAALPFTSPPKFVRKHRFMAKSRKSLFSDLKTLPEFSRVDAQQSALMHHPSQNFGRYPDRQREDIAGLYNLTHGRFYPRRRNILEGENSITAKAFYEGLGETPARVKYAETFLVFNSDINPYKHYVPFDNLKMTPMDEKRSKPAKQRDFEDINLQMAPKTIKEKERLQLYESEGYNYKPEFKQLGNLDLQGGLEQFLGGIVSLDVQQVEVQTYAPSKGDIVKNRMAIPEPQLMAQQSQSQIQYLTTQQTMQNIHSQTQLAHTQAPVGMQTMQNAAQAGQQVAPPIQGGGVPFPGAGQQSNASLQPPPLQAPPLQTPGLAPPPISTLGAPPVGLAPPPISTLGAPPMGLAPPPIGILSAPPMGLAPPPISTLGAPPMGLAPPPISTLGAPPIGLAAPPPPPMLQPAPAPAAASGGGESGEGGARNALLEAIRAKNVKLKPRQVKETGIHLKKPGEEDPKPAAGGGGGGGGGSMMDQLRAQIAKRYAALNQKGKKTQNNAKTKVVDKGDSDGEQNSNDENGDD